MMTRTPNHVIAELFLKSGKIKTIHLRVRPVLFTTISFFLPPVFTCFSWSILTCSPPRLLGLSKQIPQLLRSVTSHAAPPLPPRYLALTLARVGSAPLVYERLSEDIKQAKYPLSSCMPISLSNRRSMMKYLGSRPSLQIDTDWQDAARSTTSLMKTTLVLLLLAKLREDVDANAIILLLGQ